MGVQAGGMPRPCCSPHPNLGATASAKGAQFNVPPFPASATAEGRQLNGAPSPAKGEGVGGPGISIPAGEQEMAQDLLIE